LGRTGIVAGSGGDRHKALTGDQLFKGGRRPTEAKMEKRKKKETQTTNWQIDKCVGVGEKKTLQNKTKGRSWKPRMGTTKCGPKTMVGRTPQMDIW